jgi:DNA-binding transcriptional LysR family regulator
MFLRSLRVFHETVRLQSIRKASTSLGIAPSSASRQIDVLEHEIGTTLLDRSASGIAVTHAGALVEEFARTVLLDYDGLKMDLDDYKGGRRALIRIAAVESSIVAGPATAIARFREQFDKVSFAINMLPAPDVVTAVKQGDADIGITFAPEPDPDLQTVARLDEPLFLLMRRDQATHLGETVTVGDIGAIPLGLPSAEFGIRRLLDAAGRAAGVKLTPVLSSSSFEALRQFVLEGGGGAILPKRALGQDRGDGALKACLLADRGLKHTTLDLIMLARRRPSRILKQFRDQLIHSLSQ